MSDLKIVSVDDKRMLEAFFRRDPLLNVYYLGDLDDDYWPHTKWYGLSQDEHLLAVAMIYSGLSVPALLCTDRPEDVPHQRQLLESLADLLPGRFFCHLGLGSSDVLAGRYNMTPHGLHHKMGLVNPAKMPSKESADVVVLPKDDLPEVEAFYADSYLGNWFEPRMLDSGQCCGLRVGGKLVSIAGIHVYSPAYRVAALGNIATHPDHRNKGLARRVTGELCRRLLASTEHIGLNVKADNAPAIACYRSLGFEVVGSYDEFTAERK